LGILFNNWPLTQIPVVKYSSACGSIVVHLIAIDHKLDARKNVSQA